MPFRNAGGQGVGDEEGRRVYPQSRLARSYAKIVARTHTREH